MPIRRSPNRSVQSLRGLRAAEESRRGIGGSAFYPARAPYLRAPAHPDRLFRMIASSRSDWSRSPVPGDHNQSVSCKLSAALPANAFAREPSLTPAMGCSGLLKSLANLTALISLAPRRAGIPRMSYPM